MYIYIHTHLHTYIHIIYTYVQYMYICIYTHIYIHGLRARGRLFVGAQAGGHRRGRQRTTAQRTAPSGKFSPNAVSAIIFGWEVSTASLRFASPPTTPDADNLSPTSPRTRRKP